MASKVIENQEGIYYIIMHLKKGVTRIPFVSLINSFHRHTTLTFREMSPENHPTLGNGKVCYLEIPALDVKRSASFYKKVFGWNIRERDGNVAFDDGVGEVSGTWVVGRKPSSEPGVLISIMVDNVADAVQAVVEHGGRITQPIGIDAPEITARFSDPAGNVFSLYQERN